MPLSIRQFLKPEKQNTRSTLTLGTSLIAMIIDILVNFFLSPYIVKTLGPEANGFTQLANNFINYATLITVALNSMAGRFITINYYKHDTQSSNEYYSSVIIGNIAIFLLLLLPATYCIIRLDNIINIGNSNILHVKYLFAFVFANFFLSQIISIINIATYVTNKQYLQNPVIVSRTILRAILLLFVYSFFTPKIYYIGLIGFSLTFFSIPVFYRIKKQVLPELEFDIKYFKGKAILQLITSGIWNTINQCGNLLMTGFDLLITNLFLGPTPMGILSIAKIIPNLIIQIAATVDMSFSSNLTIAYTDVDREKKVNESLDFAMKCSNILISIPIMIMCIYSENFYRLWVPTMNAHELSILSILTCISFIPFAGTEVLYNVFTTTNKLKVNSLSVVIGGILNLLIVIFLLRTTDLGLIAVTGVSSIISILRNFFITVPYTAKILNLKWWTFYKDVMISLLCCLINGSICYLIQKLILPNDWLRMVLSVGCASFLCLIAIFMILFGKEDRKQLILKIKSFSEKYG